MKNNQEELEINKENMKRILDDINIPSDVGDKVKNSIDIILNQFNFMAEEVAKYIDDRKAEDPDYSIFSKDPIIHTTFNKESIKKLISGSLDFSVSHGKYDESIERIASITKEGAENAIYLILRMGIMIGRIMEEQKITKMMEEFKKNS